MTEYNVTENADAAALLNDWRRLYPRAAAPGFFQSPAWMTAWLGLVQERDRLIRIDATEDGEPVALGVLARVVSAPLTGLRHAWFQEFADEGRQRIYPEYLDFLLTPQAGAGCRAGAIAALFARARGVDGFVFRNLTPEIATAVKLASASCGFDTWVLREQPVYVCALNDSRFSETLSKSLQTKIRRAHRLYEERGPVVIESADTTGKRAVAWAQLRALHTAAWRRKGERSVFEAHAFLAFHEHLIADAASTDFLIMKNAGRIIGVLYNFVHGDRVMNYQSAFQIEEDNRLAPGFLLHSAAAEHYGARGFRSYDLLAGEAEYKSRLGEQALVLTSLVVEPPTWRNRLRRAVRSALGRGQKPVEHQDAP